MFSSSRGQFPTACPRCRAVLSRPVTEEPCFNCGYYISSFQASTPATPSGAGAAPSGSGLFKQPGQIISPAAAKKQLQETDGLIRHSGPQIQSQQTDGLLRPSGGESLVPPPQAGLGQTGGLLKRPGAINPSMPARMGGGYPPSGTLPPSSLPVSTPMYTFPAQGTPSSGPGPASMLPTQPPVNTYAFTAGSMVPAQPPVNTNTVLPADQANERHKSTARSTRGREVTAQRRNRPPLIYIVTVLFVFVFLIVALVRTGVSLPLLSTTQVTSTPVPAYPLPKGMPIFADSFVSNISGWNLQKDANSYDVEVGNGLLTLGSKKNQLIWEVLPGERSFTDFQLVVNATLIAGDRNSGYGVYIRGAGSQGRDLSSYYRFELYGDGSYAVFKGTVNQDGKTADIRLAGYALHQAIQKEGKANQIMIIARGPMMTFVVNGQAVKTFADRSYTAGMVAFFVSKLPESQTNAQVQFSRLAIYPSHT